MRRATATLRGAIERVVAALAPLRRKVTSRCPPGSSRCTMVVVVVVVMLVMLAMWVMQVMLVAHWLDAPVVCVWNGWWLVAERGQWCVRVMLMV